jgi:hypothetical protein
MNAPEKRLAVNEALFRETNERVEERVRLFVGAEERFGLLCECAALECKERITLSRDEYGRVRSDPAQFVVKPGHTVDELEDVLLRNDRFEIVRKRGVAAEVAEFLADVDASEDIAPPA